VAGAFAAAGFLIEEIIEPQPTEEALRQYPVELEPEVGVPNFIVYRLRRAGTDRLDARRG
jgi:hypothetical protein